MMNTKAATVSAMHKHARECKKGLGDCLVCQTSMEAIASVPLKDLAIVLQDSQAYPFKVSIQDRIVDTIESGMLVHRLPDWVVGYLQEKR